MLKEKNKVILDTNILISFLLSKQDSKFDKILEKNKITLVFSKELLEEFIEVTSRPKFKKYFTKSDIKSFLLKLKSRTVFVKVSSKVNVCRDSKDNFLLALAKDSKATHLISGDSDLLVLNKFKKTQIITLSDYLIQI
jgi:putative PIN family toxin of toxin-antitoxin system